MKRSVMRGDIIKHERSMDVCFYIIQMYEGSTHWKYKGWWMNQGYVNSWVIGDKTATIKLPKTEVQNLLYCRSIDMDVCLRNVEWSKYD